jgi:transformation/transcription domain-associated protein
MHAIVLKCVTPSLQLARVLALVSYDELTPQPAPTLNADGTPAATPYRKPPLSRVFARYSDAVPAWIFIPWIPQLLSGLGRPEVEACRKLLFALATVYPQALYFQLRAFENERREMAIKYKKSQPASAANPVEVMANYASDIMMHARKLHPSITEADYVADEIPHRFRVTPEEETFAFVSSLIEKCVVSQQQASYVRMQDMVRPTPPQATGGASGSTGTPTATYSQEARLVEKEHNSRKVFQTALLQLAQKVFHPNSAGNNLPQILRQARFIARYRQAFYADFLPHLFPSSTGSSSSSTGSSTPSSSALAGRKHGRDEDDVTSGAASPSVTNAAAAGATTPSNAAAVLPPNPNEPATIAQMLSRLKAWRAVLLVGLVRRNLHVTGELGALDMSELCPPLSLETPASASELEVPGQYPPAPGVPADAEPLLSRHVRVVGYDAAVEVVILHGAMTRRLAMVGDDGRRHHFLVQGSSPAFIGTDARMSQLYSLLSVLLSRSTGARQRRLAMSAPFVAPLSVKARMVAYSPATVTFASLLDAHICHAQAQHAQRIAYGVPSTPPLLTCSEDLIALFRDKLLELAQPHRGFTGEAAQSSQLALNILIGAMRAVASTLPATALAATLQRSLASPEEYSALRARATTQIAGISFASYMLMLLDRSPSRIAINRANAVVHTTDARLTFNQHAGLQEGENVPFRLTRNMTAMMTPQGVTGPFASSLIAIARTVFVQFEWMSSYAAVFFRDEVSEAQFYRHTTLIAPVPPPQQPGDAPPPALPPNTFDAVTLHRRVTSNVHTMMTRVAELHAPTFSSKLLHSGLGTPATSREALESLRGFFLIAQAMEELFLARMHVTWHPWF